MARQLSRQQLIERSIVKKYRKELWNPFIAAVKRYELIQAGDRVAVCISGGKDSMLQAKLIQQLQRVSEVPFEAKYLVMDPGYHPVNRAKIEENAALLNIPIQIFDTNIFAVTEHEPKNCCYLCARMRRGHLYSLAQSVGCNKIALGHHFDDVIETTLMGMLYGGQIQGMMPKLHSTNFPGMELIRPLYCVKEKDIIAWKRYNDLEFIQCACPDDGEDVPEPGWHRHLQAAGGEAAHRHPGRGEQPGAQEYFQSHPRRQLGHHGGLQVRRSGAHVFGVV